MEKREIGSARRAWTRLRESFRSCSNRVDAKILHRLPSSRSYKPLRTVMDDGGPVPDEMLKEFYIPNYILVVPDLELEHIKDPPQCPVIVFINSKSGGQLGGNLLKTYRELLNEHQVFDLTKEAPDKVLHKIYANLEKLKSINDVLASEIHSRLRLIVAGGDGTASWLLGVVSDLKLTHPPPIATVPLGTGNNLPYSFGWGRKNPGTDRQSVKSFLRQVKDGREMKIDRKVIIHFVEDFGTTSVWEWMLKYHMDFIRSGNFIQKKFKNQLTNQTTYAKLVSSQGWFCASLTQPSSRNIAQLAKVKIIKKHGGTWQDLHVPHSIRSIICLNLPSFSGGLNPWGTPNSKRDRDRDFTPPYVDDGRIEVVGFRDAWHGLVLLSSKGHGTRLAQAHRIRFEFHKGAAEHTYMRIDGEPWKQPLPENDDTVMVEISHLGQVNMLASHDCISRSVHDPWTPASASHHHEDEHDSGAESSDAESEERRKFGAAETFRLPDNFDIAHVS